MLEDRHQRSSSSFFLAVVLASSKNTSSGHAGKVNLKKYWDQISQARRETKRTIKVEDNTNDYWQLQHNQEMIGWDNLLQGKFARDNCPAK